MGPNQALGAHGLVGGVQGAAGRGAGGGLQWCCGREGGVAAVNHDLGMTWACGVWCVFLWGVCCLWL